MAQNMNEEPKVNREAFEAYLKSPTAQNRHQTAITLTDPITSMFKTGGPDKIPELWGLWAVFLDYASKADTSTAEGQSTVNNLVDLAGSIKALGPLTRPNPDKPSEIQEAKTWGGSLWNELAFFGAACREQWNDGPPKMAAGTWAALNFFVARLTATGVLDMKLYGIWALRDCLETSRPSTLRDVQETGDQQSEPVTEDLLPAAVAWIDGCGEHLLRLCKDSVSVANKNHNPGAPGDAAKQAGVEDGGFSVSRWKFWRSTFATLSEQRDDNGGREKLAKIAYQGFEKMKTWDDQVGS